MLAMVKSIIFSGFILVILASVVENTQLGWFNIPPADANLHFRYPNHTLLLRPANHLDENSIHSCYEYKLLDSHGKTQKLSSFCYPSIIITGWGKCSTSALFQLLYSFPNNIASMKNGTDIVNKENCPFSEKGQPSLVEFFESNPKRISLGKTLISGCISPPRNMKLIELLNNPNTFYILIVRDYLDFEWAAYNYWCNNACELNCNTTRAKIGSHKRSPELFHQMVLNTISGKGDTCPSKTTDSKCTRANSFFRKITEGLWTHIPVENFLLVTSEQLSDEPELVWYKIAISMGWSVQHPDMKSFASVRYNTNSKKGVKSSISVAKYVPGVYQISKFQPVLPETRGLLSKCWIPDCVWVSVMANTSYATCSHLAREYMTSNGHFYQPDAFNFSSAALEYISIRAQYERGTVVPFKDRKIA